MSREVIFKLGKPETNQEFKDLKQFKIDLKTLLKAKRGRIKVAEKFRDFTFTIPDCTPAEEQIISVFLKENKTVELLD